MKELKFFICKICGNQADMIYSSGAVPVCCGEPMTGPVANTVEASHEKHIPVVAVEGDTVTVKVGSAVHPMVPEHYIEWIVLQTEQGVQRRLLQAGQQPEARFALVKGDKAVAAYAYCNLHGLWKTVIKL